MGANSQIIGEVVQRRTLTSKHYLMADGSYQALLYKNPVHFEDEDGNLHNIDHTLLDEADFDTVQYPVYKEKAQEFRDIAKQIRGLKSNGTIDRLKTMWHPLRVPHNTKINKQFKRGYEIGKGTDRLKFTPVGASASLGYISPDEPSTVDFQDVWNDTDVKLEVNDLGIKETITLKSTNAPTKFTFKVDGTGLADDFTAGRLSIRAPWLEDAAGTRRDVTQTIRREADGTYIDLVADVSGLVYPVVIDPTTTIKPDANAGKDAYTSSSSGAAGSNYGNDSTLWTGATSGGSAYYTTYIQFDISSIPAGSTVTAATLYLYLNQQTNNAGGPIEWDMAPVSATWSESTITYNNHPTKDTTKQLTWNGYGTGTQAYQNAADWTSYVQQWFAGTMANNGVAMWSNVVNEYQSWESSDAGAAYSPYLNVTYDQPPSAPTVTSPNGGETWNAQQTITWTAATDPDTAQTSLQYNIDYSTDNGQTWNQIVSLTAAGATSYTFDFSNVPQSSTCLIRIRAFDGVMYSPYDQSNGVFTIQHNQAPTAPTNLAPAGGAAVDLAVVERLSWQHNDPNNTSGGDPQSKFDLQWSSNGGSTWNTVTQTTPNQYWNAPASTFPHGNIVWQVRTYDQAGVAGPYSAQQTFFAGNKPAAPTITAPTNNSIVGVAQPTVQWSSNGQSDYQVQVLDATNAVYWDSTDTQSTNKAVTITKNLANGAAYTIKLRIKNSDGLWSDWVSVAITVSYTPPAQPILTARDDTTSGRIALAITNTAPSGTQPAVSYSDIYRRDTGTTAWTRIATNVPNNGTYNDYAVASDKSYDYYVRTFGTNGTFNNSAVQTGSVVLSGIWLHDVSNPSGTALNLPFNDSRAGNWKADVAFMQFAGRSRKVAEFGDFDDYSFKFKVSLDKNLPLWSSLQALCYAKGTLCARDYRGRKVFGVISVLPDTDTFYGHDVPLGIQEIDFSEVV